MRSRLALALVGLALALAPVAAHAQEREPARRLPSVLNRDSIRAERERADTLDDDAPRMRPPRAVPPPDSVMPAAPAMQDSLMDALARIEGYAVTRYTGSGASFDADSGAVRLEGPATIVREGQNIAADSLLTFDQESGIVCGYGNPVLSGEGNPINSDQICYDTERRLGMALGARTEFQQNATWFVHGERVFTVGSDRIYSAGTEFTSCDLEIPHYHFTASRFKMVNERILVARDVTLSFGDVPVFWLPFLVQNLTDGRRSGLLTPSFGLSDVVQTSEGHTRQITNLGFFWAINDYMGAEFALGWRSSDWLSMRGEFDYQWTRQFLRGGLNVQQYFREEGRELALHSDNEWQPGERTTVRVGGDYVTSSTFIRRETFDPNELNRTLQSDASFTHRFRNGANLSLGASRDQQIMAERVTTTLPRVGLSLPALTLASTTIGGVPTELIYTISGLSYTRTDDDRDEEGSAVASDRDSQTQNAGAGHQIRFGNLTFSQGIGADETVLDEKPPVEVDDTTDTEALPGETTRRLNWNTSLSYRQDLIGTMRITPQLSVNGQMLQSPRTGDETLSSPVALNFGAALAAEIYGFWPGVGPFERFRHKVSPSLSYNFRPEANGTLRQDSIFGGTTRATNQIQLVFSQTFEGKRPAEEGADSAGAPASDDQATPSDQPRSQTGQQPVRLLSIETSALAYDFEAASRGEEGLTTTDITNTIASDLLKNLRLSFRHSLFDPVPVGTTETGDRHFDLHLDNVNASFGLTGESWLFRILGLGSESSHETPEEAALDTADTESIVPSDDDRGLVPGGGGAGASTGIGRVGSRGTWRADLTYSLQRPRDVTLDESQQISARFTFQPTENWSAGWSTSYSVTDSEFRNHDITLTRALHEWQADFRITRAQNGNFAFEFEARLNDLPDLRIPYDQRTRGDED